MIVIVLVIASGCFVSTLVFWKARVSHILRTTPLAVTLKQMLLHESMLLPMWDDIRGSVDVTLFEGLPHQYYEAEALKSEEKRKSTIRLGIYPFYNEPLTLKEGDVNKLLPLLMSRSSFETPTGAAKACGGFHPDYALRLSSGATSYSVMICLGCGDIQIIWPDSEKTFELTDRAKARLHAILAQYRKNRPPIKMGMRAS